MTNADENFYLNRGKGLNMFPGIVKSYGKHRFLKAIERKNYLKMDGPKSRASLADVLTKPVSHNISCNKKSKLFMCISYFRNCLRII